MKHKPLFGQILKTKGKKSFANGAMKNHLLTKNHP
jgi:hypothetical protein